MKKPPFIWLNVFVFVITFLVAAIAVPYRAITHGFDGFEIISALICFCFCGMSITMGYHRLWSHRTYQANSTIRFICAIGGAFALQNSILHWCSDHRVHHKHVDNNGVDPYSAKMGFWYSHIGWMLREYQHNRYSDYTNVRDLQKDKIVMWQHKNYLLLSILTNFGIPIALGLIHGDVLSSILLAGFLRLVLSHHTTFFINSLAHVWGKQTYTDKNTARDNGILAFLTFGEGYHNYHHIFENDYRNGIRWWQFDPTKWLIKFCSYFNWTTKLKTTPEDKIAKAKTHMQLLNSKKKIKARDDYEELFANLEQQYDLLIEQMTQYYAIKKQLIAQKKGELSQSVESSHIMTRYNELKLELRENLKQWHSMRAQYA